MSSNGSTVPRIVSHPDESAGGDTLNSTRASSSGVTPILLRVVVRLALPSFCAKKVCLSVVVI